MWFLTASTYYSSIESILKNNDYRLKYFKKCGVDQPHSGDISEISFGSSEPQFGL